MSYRFADSFWVPSWSCSQAVSKTLWHIPLLCVQWKTPGDGQRNCPKHVEFYYKNKFEKILLLVGFIIRNSTNFSQIRSSFSSWLALGSETARISNLSYADVGYKILLAKALGFWLKGDFLQGTSLCISVIEYNNHYFHCWGAKNLLWRQWKYPWKNMSLFVCWIDTNGFVSPHSVSNL